MPRFFLTDYLMLAVAGGDVHGGVVKPLLDDGRRVAARDQVARIRPHKIFDRLEIACREKMTEEIDGGEEDEKKKREKREERIQ